MSSSRLPVRKGSKRHRALIALLGVARKRFVVTMEELIAEVSALGLSKSYAEGLVKELASSGILKRVREGAYAVDVEALEKVLKEVEWCGDLALLINRPREHKVGYERLLWGFWDREAGEKRRRNWRSFVRAYNRIKPFDFAVLQIARTGEAHALGVVKETFYDDQTPVWPKEIERRVVLYPWRVAFSFMIFSEEPILRRFIKLSDYIDGYGIGELSPIDFNDILAEVSKKFKLAMRGM